MWTVKDFQYWTILLLEGSSSASKKFLKSKLFNYLKKFLRSKLFNYAFYSSDKKKEKKRSVQ